VTDLFSPLTLRGVTFPNRIGVSPMCQYCCAEDGKPTEWHFAYLVSRAQGGAGLVCAEATAVTPEGRISPGDLGLWEDGQIAGHARLAAAIARLGAVPGVQLAHAGRKAGRHAPWDEGRDRPNRWTPKGASPLAFDHFAAPEAMTEAEIAAVIAAFAATARRAVRAGYRFVEVHAAHAYLLHSFCSPLSNARTDRWGGSFENRTRIVVETTRAVRDALPEDAVLSVRLSHTDWVEGGWDTAQTVELAGVLKREAGADIIDVSSGGVSPQQKFPLGPGYQVPGAEAVRRGAGIPVAAVGMITEPEQARAILAEGKADLILMARALLRDPYWPLRAAAALGRTEALRTPPQYDRGWNTLSRTAMDRALAHPIPPIA
jgi:2,4-dienoyl-CoA reductase-like NADH-dependent reductase (Old Yellow Enzyme family)